MQVSIQRHLLLLLTHLAVEAEEVVEQQLPSLSLEE
jgi:hypothetical protein